MRLASSWFFCRTALALWKTREEVSIPGTSWKGMLQDWRRKGRLVLWTTRLWYRSLYGYKGSGLTIPVVVPRTSKTLKIAFKVCYLRVQHPILIGHIVLFDLWLTCLLFELCHCDLVIWPFVWSISLPLNLNHWTIDCLYLHPHPHIRNFELTLPISLQRPWRVLSFQLAHTKLAKSYTYTDSLLWCLLLVFF